MISTMPKYEPRFSALYDIKGTSIDEGDTLEFTTNGPEKGCKARVICRKGVFYCGEVQLTRQLIEKNDLEVVGSVPYLLEEERERE